MERKTRYALALFAGAVAGAVAFVAARPVVEPFRTWFVAGLNAIVWTGAVGLYAAVYDRLGGTPAGGDQGSAAAGAKWGGIAGLVASVGVSGPAVLLVGSLPFRYVAAVGLFTFGIVLWSMAAGMGAVATRLDAERGDPSAATEKRGGQTPAGD